MVMYPGKLIANLYRKSVMYWGHALKEYDISTAEYPVLIVLHQKQYMLQSIPQSHAKFKGMTQEEIASELNLDKSGITRVIKSLLEKGLIQREKDQQDHRCNRIYLTKKGEACWEPIQNGMKEWSQIATQGIDSEEIEKVEKILSRMADNINNNLVDREKEFRQDAKSKREKSISGCKDQ